jgi:hypothetical protein
MLHRRSGATWVQRSNQLLSGGTVGLASNRTSEVERGFPMTDAPKLQVLEGEIYRYCATATPPLVRL